MRNYCEFGCFNFVINGRVVIGSNNYYLFILFIRMLILFVLNCNKNLNKLNQLHAVSRTQLGRQREPSVKTIRSPLSTEFWRYCVLSGRAQRRALPRHQKYKYR